MLPADPQNLGEPAISLVPGRECGGCNACCTALTIDDPALQKPQGYRCRNLQRDNGCAIYATRPKTCQEFFCGWRMLKWVRQELRPDTSGVLVRLHYQVSETGTSRLGIVVTLLRRSALKAEGLAETVAAAVAADRPVFMEVPGPPGHTSGRGQLNAVLSDAVHARDKPRVLDILRRAYAASRGGESVPIVFGHH